MTSKEKDKLWKIFLKLKYGEVVDVDKLTGVEMFSSKGIELTKKEYDFIEPFLKASYEYKYTIGGVEIVTNGVSLSCGMTRFGDRAFVDIPFENKMKLEDLIRQVTMFPRNIPYKNFETEENQNEQ